MTAPLKVGELLGVGFRGPALPEWITPFAERYGLGAVILFDYDYQGKKYQNNIESPPQLRSLCKAIHALPGNPLILIDQEGGKVRRLKEKLGFAPLPSAKVFAALPPEDQRHVATASFREMASLGIDMNLAPVIDLDFNPHNPDIGAIERSFSSDPSVVERCTQLLDGVARTTGLQLCLKHYPGLGGATTNSHLELTDLSGTVDPTQLALFTRWGQQIYGQAILVSHGRVTEWDALPVSMSAKALGELRRQAPEALLMTDDVQMQGLQVFLKTPEAAGKAVLAGMDLVLIGNNLLDEEAQMPQVAAELERVLGNDPARARAVQSIGRVQARKNLRRPHPL